MALKAAHHGSDTFPTLEFSEVVNSQLVVISVGADVKFRYLGGEVMDTLREKLSSENIYHADEYGTIEFITNGERLCMSVENRVR